MNKENDLLAQILNSKAFIFIAGIIILICSGIGLGLAVINQVNNQNSVVQTPIQAEEALVKFDSSETELQVEVADTPTEWSIGLMNRTGLGQDKGMLFIFEEATERSFWMKNTLISLDIIFMNSNLEVVTIHSNTLPNQTNILYKSSSPAQYVLEVNGGWANSHGITIGSKLSIKALN